MSRPTRAAILALAALGAGPVLAGCATDDGAAASGNAITVGAGDSACDVSRTVLTAGPSVLSITNQGSQVTEVYVYGDADRIFAERENIGPGTSANLTVDLAAGTYQIACKPGQVGDGIRQNLTVAANSAAATAGAEHAAAVAAYRAYVRKQVEATITTTETFTAAVKAGDVAEAKKLYAPSRVGWESIEPVAESFGTLDPRIDAREADLEEGQKWTGWHRLEKALWEENSTKGMAPIADQLTTDLDELKQKAPTAVINTTSMANGAKELLDEVATGKITGEEEAFSHTDLVDFRANLDGAEEVFSMLKPISQKNDPELTEQLTTQFASLDKLLDTYQRGDTYVSYDTVGEADRKKLSDAVNALAEPLSKLAAAVTPR